MRVLVTGGAGFVGSHLAEALLQRGEEVTVLDSLDRGDLGHLGGMRGHRRLHLVRGDIRNAALLRRATRRMDAVFHLAAKIHVDESIRRPGEFIDVNVHGTLNVLQACLRNEVDHLAVASSSEAYGSAEYVPMDEAHPLNPASPYAASKAAADRLCFSFHNTYGLPVVIVRNFNTYGPRQRSRGYGGVIAIFIRRVLQGQPPVVYGSGRQTRDYIYVSDVVDAYLRVLDRGRGLAGEAVNFGTGVEVPILDIARRVIALSGKKMRPVHGPPRPGEVSRLCADITRARRRLGFRPRVSFPRGLEATYRWFASRPSPTRF